MVTTYCTEKTKRRQFCQVSPQGISCPGTLTKKPNAKGPCEAEQVSHPRRVSLGNAHFQYSTLRLTKTTPAVAFPQARASNRNLFFQYCQYAVIANIANIVNILLAGSETTCIQNEIKATSQRPTTG